MKERTKVKVSTKRWEIRVYKPTCYAVPKLDRKHTDTAKIGKLFIKGESYTVAVQKCPIYQINV